MAWLLLVAHPSLAAHPSLVAHPSVTAVATGARAFVPKFEGSEHCVISDHALEIQEASLVKMVTASQLLCDSARDPGGKFVTSCACIH